MRRRQNAETDVVAVIIGRGILARVRVYGARVGTIGTHAVVVIGTAENVIIRKLFATLVTNGHQQVAHTIVGKWGVEVDGYPTCSSDRQAAFLDQIVGGQ